MSTLSSVCGIVKYIACVTAIKVNLTMSGLASFKRLCSPLASTFLSYLILDALLKWMLFPTANRASEICPPSKQVQRCSCHYIQERLHVEKGGSDVIGPKKALLPFKEAHNL